MIAATIGRELVALGSVAWEIGNAFSAMFKRGRMDLEQASQALRIYRSIPIRWADIDMEEALRIAHNHQIYAYDAYHLQAAFPVPLEFRHRKVEVIFIAIDEQEAEENSRVKMDGSIGEFFGCLPDFPDREPQGEYETRQELD